MSSAEAPPPRVPAKKARRTGDQERRRQEVLARQAGARRNLTNHARQLALGGDEGFEGAAEEPLAMDTEVGRDRLAHKRTRGLIRRREHWSRQLCTPEWMVEVPHDLNGKDAPATHGWYVMARPEGKRVIVIAAGGHTVARDMSGSVVQKWASQLPGGSPGTSGGGGGYTILDCVFHELNNTFYLLDMMCWKGYSLYDCTTDFRLYWVRTKLTEALGDAAAASQGSAPRFPIVPLPYFECHPDGLWQAYRGSVPYIRDGLLFHQKAAHYALGVTPLVLLWKDDATTRYLLQEGGTQTAVLAVVSSAAASAGSSSSGGGAETPQESEEGEEEEIVEAEEALEAEEKESAAAAGPKRLRLVTSDGREVQTPGVSHEELKAWQLQSGDLARFSLASAQEVVAAEDPAGVSSSSSQRLTVAVVTGLKFQRKCGPMRPAADSWSKILFQSRVWHGKGMLSFTDLLEASAASAAAAAGSGTTAEGGK